MRLIIAMQECARKKGNNGGGGDGSGNVVEVNLSRGGQRLSCFEVKR